jgi:hypothetical protein
MRTYACPTKNHNFWRFSRISFEAGTKIRTFWRPKPRPHLESAYACPTKNHNFWRFSRISFEAGTKIHTFSRPKPRPHLESACFGAQFCQNYPHIEILRWNRHLRGLSGVLLRGAEREFGLVEACQSKERVAYRDAEG